MLEMLEAVDRIARLVDDANISADMAAAYLCITPKTLETWRRNGDGPPYCQPNVGGHRARNQKITYKMGDLRKYRDQNTHTSTMDAAVARGMAYTTHGTANFMLIDQEALLGFDWLHSSASYDELREAVIPLWLDTDGRILALVGECDAQENAAMIESGADVEWITAADMRGRPWAPDAKDLARTLNLLAHLFVRSPR